MTYAAIVKLARALPGVEESTSFGTPSRDAAPKSLVRAFDAQRNERGA